MPTDLAEQHYLIPDHAKGIEKNLSYAITLESGEDADDWFVEGMERLLKISNWNKLATTINLIFSLTDHHGKNVSRRAHRGDYIKVLPKGTMDNEPHWIRVEAIEYDDYPDTDRETIAIHLQPSAGPFYRNGHKGNVEIYASATFVIERQTKKLSVSYHGRNYISDAANQNQTVLAAALSWFSVPDQQWENLLKGIFE